MNILQINTNDYLGGAARACHRLYEGLRRRGVQSRLLSLNRVLSDPNIVSWKANGPNFLMRAKSSAARRRFQRYKNKPKGREHFSLDRTPHRVSNEFFDGVDIINLHWIAGFIDHEDFFASIPREIPIVWTLHDMNPFTGGCHYTAGCERFLMHCGRCPQLGSDWPFDLSRSIWKRKRASYVDLDKRLTIVTPSRWLASEARRSALFKRFETHVIPYGLDTDVFAPRDKRTSREVLGIPSDARVVLFVSDSIANRRKGFNLLRRAFEGLSPSSGIFLAYVGAGKPEIDPTFPSRRLGNISDERLLSYAYSAADVFVIPSTEDNLPNIVLESMACGTPVMGFSIGGIPDMVRSDVTGALVPPGDIAALRKTIVDLLEDVERLRNLSKHCRRVALDEYSLETQAKEYERLFLDLLSRKNRKK